MPSWSVKKSRGWDEQRALFKDAPRKVQEIGRQWAKDVAADETKYIVKAWDNSTTHGSKRTGRFAKLIKPYSRAFVIGVTIGDYPKLGQKLYGWIKKGTPKHIIDARTSGISRETGKFSLRNVSGQFKARAHALSFIWHGRRRFFVSVNHPGTRPNDFVAKGSKAFDRRVQFWLRDLEKRLAKMLNGK